MVKSKKGFTLVELMVVIAIAAIIVTMICMFMVSYRTRSYEIYKVGNTVNDTNDFKIVVETWLAECDNGVELLEDGKGLKTADGRQLYFENKKLYVDDDAGREYETFDSCVFEMNSDANIKDVVYCTVKSGKKKIWITFDVFDPNNVTRELTKGS